MSMKPHCPFTILNLSNLDRISDTTVEDIYYEDRNMEAESSDNQSNSSDLCTISHSKDLEIFSTVWNVITSSTDEEFKFYSQESLIHKLKTATPEHLLEEGIAGLSMQNESDQLTRRCCYLKAFSIYESSTCSDQKLYRNAFKRQVMTLRGSDESKPEKNG